MSIILGKYIKSSFKQSINKKQVKVSFADSEIYEKSLTFARKLYHQEEFRCPETIRQLSKDLQLAKATIKEYVEYFNFNSMTVDDALRCYLKVFWPDDEPELQDLLITHFSIRFLECTQWLLTKQNSVYFLSWAIILLNADLNGNHKGKKMTCEEFMANIICLNLKYPFSRKTLKDIYKSIKGKPLEAFRVQSRHEAVSMKKTMLQDFGLTSTFGTDNNPTTKVHKTGILICKRVMDRNGKTTRKSRRSWKPFTVILKGMGLHLQKDSSDLREENNKQAIGLHHAMAYPIDYKKMSHVLCLRTADSRLFYFQAENKVKQSSWVTLINLIAARYSAPPLTAASLNIEECCPLVLPSFPTTLSLEQQLKYHKDKVQKISEHLANHVTLFHWDTTVDHMEQEEKRYTKYVTALEEFVSKRQYRTRLHKQHYRTIQKE